MDAERWRKIDRLFHAVMECAPAQRREVLSKTCGDDSGLRTEVESLLSAHERASSFIELPAFEVPPCNRAENTLAISRGQRIGAYTIRAVLGRGGMGVVYEAEQGSPRRTVALKVMRALPCADELTPRLFRRETQALARLEHPGIAALYEAGRTDDGWYYLAMERVAGSSLTQHARDARLTLTQRLGLFEDVCDAVDYAHQRGVIHRDLKPSNVLVSADGRPKVLDFGLARILDPQAAETRITDPGAFHGTLAYASPEQTRGGDDVDVRSDVYSLGVLLYQLATDHLPYDLRGVALPEAARVICEQAPAGDPALRGELGSIVLKALRKDREERYRSAATLADDIRRHLTGRPVEARPPSALYYFRKFVGRNRVASSIVCALMLGLAGLGLVNGWLARKYADQRDSATQAATDERVARKSAEESIKFLESVLTSADPSAGGQSELTLAQVVSGAEERLAELDNEPLIQARVLTALGRVNVALAKYDHAIDLLDRAMALIESARGDSDPSLAAVLEAESAGYSAAGNHEKAVETAARGVAILDKAYGREHLDTAGAISSLGTAQYNARAFAEATATFDEALAIRRRLLGDRHLDVADAVSNLGSAYLSQGRVSEGMPLLRESLRIRVELLGDSPAVCQALTSLAAATYQIGSQETVELLKRRLDMARRIFHAGHPQIASALKDFAFIQEASDAVSACELEAEALGILRAAYGDDHPLVADALNDLGCMYQNRGLLSEAEECHTKALDIRRRHFGPRDLRVANSMNSLAITYWSLGKLDAAAELSEQVLSIWKEVYGESDSMVGLAHQNAGAIYSNMQCWELAEMHLERAAAIYAPLSHHNLAGVWNLLANTSYLRGDFPAAEADARRSVELVRGEPELQPTRIAPLLSCLGHMLSALGRDEEARSALEESLSHYRVALSPDDAAQCLPEIALGEVLLRIEPQSARAVLDEAARLEPALNPGDRVHGDLLVARGLLLLTEGNPEAAEAPLRAALERMERDWGPAHWKSTVARARLGACLQQLGAWDEAESLLSASVGPLSLTFGADHPETERAKRAQERALAHVKTP